MSGDLSTSSRADSLESFGLVGQEPLITLIKDAVLSGKILVEFVREHPGISTLLPNGLAGNILAYLEATGQISKQNSDDFCLHPRSWFYTRLDTYLTIEKGKENFPEPLGFKALTLEEKEQIQHLLTSPTCSLDSSIKSKILSNLRAPSKAPLIHEDFRQLRRFLNLSGALALSDKVLPEGPENFVLSIAAPHFYPSDVYSQLHPITHKTPLMLAIEHKKWDLAEALLRREDLDVFIRDSEGKTAFQYLAKHAGFVSFKRLLLLILCSQDGRGAQLINIPDKEGCTPLTERLLRKPSHSGEMEFLLEHEELQRIFRSYGVIIDLRPIAQLLKKLFDNKTLPLLLELKNCLEAIPTLNTGVRSMEWLNIVFDVFGKDQQNLIQKETSEISAQINAIKSEIKQFQEALKGHLKSQALLDQENQELELEIAKTKLKTAALRATREEILQAELQPLKEELSLPKEETLVKRQIRELEIQIHTISDQIRTLQTRKSESQKAISELKRLQLTTQQQLSILQAEITELSKSKTATTFLKRDTTPPLSVPAPAPMTTEDSVYAAKV